MRTPLAPMSKQLMFVAQIVGQLLVLPASEDAHIAGEITVLTDPREYFVDRGICRPDLRWRRPGTKGGHMVLANTCTSRIHNY